MLNSLYPPLVVGGAERSVAELARELRGLGVEVAVATLSPDGESRPVAVWEDGIEVFRLRLANPVWPFGEAAMSTSAKAVWNLADSLNPVMGYRLLRVMRAWKPTVLHTNNLSGFSASVWVAARILGVPTIHTARDYYLTCTASTRFRANRPCTKQCGRCRIATLPRRNLTRLLDQGVGISGFIAATEGKLCADPSLGWTVVPNQPQLGSTAICTGRHELKRIVYIGRIEPAKGIEVLIEATRLLRERGLQPEVVVAGTGEDGYARGLEAMAEGTGVSLVGFRPPAEVLTTGTVVVVPSVWWEPQGRVVREARVMGLPVVASRSGGLTEEADRDRGVRLFGPGNSGELAQILEGLLGTEWDHLPRRPDRSSPAEDYLRLYRGLVDRR